MHDISDEEFENIVKQAMDDIPERYAEHMKNIGFVIEDDPNAVQREKLKLHHGQMLFGLYEGVPLTQRNNNYSGVLPDKITIFKNPALMVARSRADLISNIRNTVWHEVAHYFGLGHDRIDELENR